MIACWTVKGGSGVSVVAALLARVVAGEQSSLLVDVAGDQPSLLALDERPMPGLKQWAEAAHHADSGALEKLAVPTGMGIRLVGSGAFGPAESDAHVAGTAAAHLATLNSVDVVDAGCVSPLSRLAAAVVSHAVENWLVIRPCYLSLARAVASPIMPTRIILVEEPRRSLDKHDVEAALGVEVAAVLRWDPALARAVDSGRIDSYKGRNLSIIRELARRANASFESIAPLDLGAQLPRDVA